MCTSIKRECLSSHKSKKSCFFVLMVLVYTLVVDSNFCFGTEGIMLKLEKIREQYLKVDTVHIKSQIVIKVSPKLLGNEPNGSILTRVNQYEYWADASGRYRIKSSFFSSDGVPELLWEYAYDGQLFRFYEGIGSLAGFSTKDPEQIATIENPLFAPLMFLTKNDDNYLCHNLKLKHVLDTTRWTEKTAGMQTVMVGQQSPFEKVAQVPAAGILVQKRFAFRVYFMEDPNWLPAKIDRVDDEGKVMTSLKILSYRQISMNGQPTYWPKNLHYGAYDPNGQMEVEFNAEIEVCQINEALPPDVFTIDLSQAKNIWDDDAKEFIKQ